MPALKISLVQTDIVWENKEENLNKLGIRLEKLRGTTDLVVLPEMFSTGFSMNSHQLAETVTGTTITILKEYSAAYGFAITGSFIACEDGKYYNRAFFITPEGKEYYYDKRHLFRMGNERDSFSAGTDKLIVNYCGWNICLLICYDLRFPVWSRNVSNQYDLLIYVANWPASRRKVWDTLLPARALENMCYVCGVNRIGIDGNGLAHNGGSVLYSPKAEVMACVTDDKEDIVTAVADLESLHSFREKFPVWKDADPFVIQ